MYIPNAPHAIDVAAPTMNAIVVYADASLSTHSHTRAAITSTNMEQMRYYASMNSAAPYWMIEPIYTIEWGDELLMVVSSSSTENLLPRSTC